MHSVVSTYHKLVSWQLMHHQFAKIQCNRARQQATCKAEGQHGSHGAWQRASCRAEPGSKAGQPGRAAKEGSTGAGHPGMCFVLQRLFRRSPQKIWCQKASSCDLLHADSKILVVVWFIAFCFWAFCFLTLGIGFVNVGLLTLWLWTFWTLKFVLFWICI